MEKFMEKLGGKFPMTIREILHDFLSGKSSLEDVEKALKNTPIEEIEHLAVVGIWQATGMNSRGYPWRTQGSHHHSPNN